jgi:hypothetical protein
VHEEKTGRGAFIQQSARKCGYILPLLHYNARGHLALCVRDARLHHQAKIRIL